MTQPKILLLIAFACSLIQVSITEYNISKVGADTLIKTADSPSYINPAKNFLEKGVWKDNFQGPSSYVQRPPFYGSLLLFSSVVSSTPMLVLKVIQYIFMFVGIFFFGKLIALLTRSKTMTVAATICFGTLPFFHGFVGYVMTEAIAPYMLILFTFSFVNLYVNRKGTILFIIVGAMILVFRTQIILFPILFVVSLIIKYRKEAKWTLLLFLPFLLWQIRVKEVMGSFQLHPIYSYSNKTIFRPPHAELTNLFRVWEHESESFHYAESILRRDTTVKSFNKVLNDIPLVYQKGVKSKLRLYQQVAFEQRLMWAKGKNKKLKIEEAFVAEIDKWRKTQGDRFFLNNWVYTPAKSFFELVKSSHLNHYVFQKTLRGNYFIEALRILAVVIVLVSILSSIMLVFMSKTSAPLKVTMLSFLLSLMYLVFVQKMNETRYMIPFLPLIFAGLWLFYNQFRNRLKKAIA